MCDFKDLHVVRDFYGLFVAFLLLGVSVDSDAAQTCNPGYVSISNQCVACTSNTSWTNYAKTNRSYCPGGQNNANLSFEQQVKKCPNGAWPTVSLAGCECGYSLTMKNGECIGALSTTDLRYGPGGVNASASDKCWAKHDASLYQKCMGFDNYNNVEPSNSNDNSEGSVLSNEDGCGYAILGRGGDYTSSYVSENTDLGNKAINVIGAGDWNSNITVVKAVKSQLANTADGCACPMYSFKHKGKTSYFYNWDNPSEINDSVELMKTLNPNVPFNKGFACLFQEYNADSNYAIKFAYGCSASTTPDPMQNPYDILFSASEISTNSNKPSKTVASICPNSNKTAWQCKGLLKNEHSFYLDPNKAYKDNSSLREYINTYGATDWQYVKQGLQHYGNNRESETIVSFCTPSNMP